MFPQNRFFHYEDAHAQDLCSEGSPLVPVLQVVVDLVSTDGNLFQYSAYVTSGIKVKFWTRESLTASERGTVGIVLEASWSHWDNLFTYDVLAVTPNGGYHGLVDTVEGISTEQDD